MTSLFFVMLVLVIGLFVGAETLRKSNEVTQAQIKKINELQKSTEDLDERYFAYDKKYKKFILKIEIKFPSQSSDFLSLPYATQEDLLKAVESGELKAGDVLKELADDNEKAEANKETEKKLRNKDQANEANVATTPAEEAKSKDQLPADIKAGIDKAEKADAARPASEKLQDKADDLAEKIEELTAVAEADKANAEKKAEALKKQEATLKEAKEALKSAQDNGSDADIVASLDKAVKAIEKERNAAQNAFDEANSPLAGYKAEIDALTDEYNKALDEVKVAKEKEANEPAKPAEEEPAKPAEKTEAEKAAEAKAEADAKVVELEKKVAEEAKKVEEATTKATKEADDVTAAQTKKDEADKAKADAEDELAKAKEEAEKAKAKVEALKKEEKDNLEALKGALEQLEKDAEAEINKNSKITDKAKALEEAKAAIGKDALLKAIEDGVITATEAAKELEDQNATAEATKDQNPQADEIGATKQEGKALSELPAADKEKLDAAYNKEASKPIVKKLQDIADDLAEKIEKLTKVADKDKADATEKAKVVEEKTAALNKQKETLEKAKTALETANKNDADQAIKDGLQDAVTKLEASVASAKTAADEAQAKFDEVNEVVKAYKDAIDELTDDYNATLGYIENLKEVPKGEEHKDFEGGVNPGDAPSEDNGSDFSGGVNDATPPTVADAPEFTGGVNPADAPVAEEKPEFNGGVNDEEAPTTENTPEFNGGVNDDNAPTEPSKPEGEAPADKPEASVEKAKGPKDEIKRLEAEIAKLKSDLKDAENNGAEDYFKEGLQKALDDTEKELNELLAAWLNNVTEVPEFKVTRYVDSDSHDISATVEGKAKEKDIAGYEFVNTTFKDGITTHIYKVKLNGSQTQPVVNTSGGQQSPAVQQGGSGQQAPVAQQGGSSQQSPAVQQTNTPAVAGTSQDNTYQAPAAKEEDKKELPNTGGKDNAAVASLGFLGLLLGALPFVKRKN